LRSFYQFIKNKVLIYHAPFGAFFLSIEELIDISFFRFDEERPAVLTDEKS